jgi:hypothetical protein
MEDIARLPPENIEAFMCGISKVLAASKAI